jgi:cytochrome c oxidase subunit 2
MKQYYRMNSDIFNKLKSFSPRWLASAALVMPFVAAYAADGAEAQTDNLEWLVTGLKALLAVTVILALVIMRMVFKLRQSDQTEQADYNNLNAKIMVAFISLGMIAAVYFSFHFAHLYLPEASSEHGIKLDKMFNLTLIVTGIVVVITHILLFWFVWKYRWSDRRRAIYYPDNNKLEMMWTIAPAIVLTVLVLDGTKNWNAIMSAPPEDAIQIELTGKQFAWNIRYAGPDQEFGETHFKKISATNELGFDWTDDSGKDDVMPGEIYMPVNKPVLLRIRARDVLHSVYLPHFRVKMDAVPGMPTQFWFTPIKTTAQMREKLGNPEFSYELACTEICGRGHFSMKRTLVVVTEEEYDAWLKKQKPYYKPEEQEGAQSIPVVTPVDTAVVAEKGKIALAGKNKKSNRQFISQK